MNDHHPEPPTKSSLRQQAIQWRDQLPMPQLSVAVCQHLAQWPFFQEAQHVLFYHPYRNEVDLRPLWAAFPQKAWYLPALSSTKPQASGEKPASSRKVSPHSMGFRRVMSPAELVPGQYGILEPPQHAPQWDPQVAATAPALILVPGLLFDRQGYRLGYGKGYYDQFLSHAPPRNRLTPVVGVTPSRLIQASLQPDHWDVPMSHLVSELGIFAVGEDFPP